MIVVVAVTDAVTKPTAEAPEPAEVISIVSAFGEPKSTMSSSPVFPPESRMSICALLPFSTAIT